MVVFRLITLFTLIDLLREVVNFIVRLFVRPLYHTGFFRLFRDFSFATLIYLSASQLMKDYSNTQFLLCFLAATAWYFIFITNGTFHVIRNRELYNSDASPNDRNFLYDIQYIFTIVIIPLYRFFAKGSMLITVPLGYDWITELAVIEQYSVIKLIFSSVGLFLFLTAGPYILAFVAFIFIWFFKLPKSIESLFYNLKETFISNKKTARAITTIVIVLAVIIISLLIKVNTLSKEMIVLSIYAEETQEQKKQLQKNYDNLFKDYESMAKTNNKLNKTVLFYESQVAIVTLTGDKFHKYGCPYTQNSSYLLFKGTSLQKKYTACSLCHGF